MVLVMLMYAAWGMKQDEDGKSATHAAGCATAGCVRHAPGRAMNDTRECFMSHALQGVIRDAWCIVMVHVVWYMFKEVECVICSACCIDTKCMMHTARCGVYFR